MTFPNGGNLPDVNGSASLYGGAFAVVLVYVAGLFGLVMPPEVAAAVTLLASGGVGILRGDTAGRNAQNRRASDPPNGKGPA